MMKIALAQINAIVGDIQGNANKIIEAAQQAKSQQAEILLVPELVLSGYPPEDLLFREDFYEQVYAALDQLVKFSHGITLVIGHPAQQDKHRFNAASVMRDGAIIDTYYKQSLPNHTVFDEERYFTPGTAACVFVQNGIRFGVNICADVWHADAPKCAADAAADVLLVLNASPYHMEKLPERHAVIRERVQETDMVVLYCNLVGGQGELVFDGYSFVMDTNGEVTHQFPGFSEGIFYVELDGISPKDSDLCIIPSLEANVYQALVIGLRDYVNKNGFNGVLLGLSGGIDSALTLAIAVDALGADHVHAVMMASEFTADISVADSREMVNLLGIQYDELPIKSLFNEYLATLSPLFANRPSDLTEENIQARIRGTLLMAISNKFGQLVISTGNKSEMAIGYATLYGDMVGGYAVLRDVYKGMVYRLSKYRNQLNFIIPQRIIDRPPSAELRPNQKDQDSLPEYEILDQIIERYVERDASIAKIIADGFNAEVVERVVQMIDRSEYKRSQAAVGTRITQRAFGKDRRYPITSKFKSERGVN